MKYYYITENFPDNSENFGSSKLGVSASNIGLSFDRNVFRKTFWEYPKNIRLDAYASDGTRILKFLNYVQEAMYILLMIPKIKTVFEQFSMPVHKWHQAEAGYNLKYIHNMKRFHNIEFDININEKRDYWVLQLLDKSREELAFEEMDFNIVDFRNRKSILRSFDTKISTFEEFNDIGREIYLATKKNEIIEDIDSPKYTYHKSYDILWAGTKVVFNDKVKTALEATNIITPENGLQFAEFTDYEIEMLGESI